MERDDFACIRGFHCWTGVAGLWYGRRPLTSPPVVIRAESLDELRGKIDTWHDQHDTGAGFRYRPGEAQG